MKNVNKFSTFCFTNPPGGATLPLSQSSRVVIFSCWFVTVVILSMYTANLTSSLTVHERKMPFDTLEGALQTNIEFYTYNSGSPRVLLQVCSIASQTFSDWKTKQNKQTNKKQSSLFRFVLDIAPHIHLSIFSNSFRLRHTDTRQVLHWQEVNSGYTPGDVIYNCIHILTKNVLPTESIARHYEKQGIYPVTDIL